MVQQLPRGKEQQEAFLSHYYYPFLIGSSSLLIALAFANQTPRRLLAWCRSLFRTFSSSRRPRFVGKPPHKRDLPDAKDSEQVGYDNKGKQTDNEVVREESAAKTLTPTPASPLTFRRRPRNDDNMNEDQPSRTTPIPMPLVFPWEDLRRGDDDNNDKNRGPKRSSASTELSTQRHGIIDAKPNMEDTRKTEQFLATMTFAQTGLRAPSCPCCR